MLPRRTMFCSTKRRGRSAKHEPSLRIFYNLRFNAIFYVFLIISLQTRTLFHGSSIYFSYKIFFMKRIWKENVY